MATTEAKGVTRGEMLDVLREAYPDASDGHIYGMVNGAARGNFDRPKERTIKVGDARYRLINCPECGSDEHRAGDCDNLG